jgi:hypothetical protein
LYKQSLGDLRTNALKQSQQTLVVDDVLHNLDERLEWLSFPRWRGLRLQADFCNDERLSSNCC